MSIIPVQFNRRIQQPYSRGSRAIIDCYFCINPTALRDEARAGTQTLKLYSVTGMAPAVLLRLSGGDPLIAETVTVSTVDSAARTVTLTSPLLFTHPLDPEEGIVDHVAILAAPTTPAFQYLRPGNPAVQTASLTFVSTGYATASLLLDTPGDWRFRAVDTGTGVEKANWSTLRVRKDDFV